MILALTYRMNRSNKNQIKYILILIISVLLVSSFLYLASNNPNEVPLNLNLVWGKFGGIKNGAQSILKMALLDSNMDQVDHNCERDDYDEMSEYLDFRRTCLLRYCGDVCITKQESDTGKDIFHQIKYNIIFIN